MRSLTSQDNLHLSGPPAVALLGRPGLAVVDLDGSGDGVAYVARLLQRALRQLSNDDPAVVELAPKHAGRVALQEQLSFLARLAWAQATGPRYWLFNHVGIARAQAMIPGSVSRPYAVILCGIEAWDHALAPDRKRVLTAARARIAISDYTARRVLSVHPELGPITACPLALLPEEGDVDAPIDRDLLSDIDDHTVAIVGRMSTSERYKGHDELLECWPRVLEAVPSAKLLVIGRGDDWPRLQAKAASMGLATRIQFTGFVSDGTLGELLRRVALFAMPSRGEGFGLVYLEAMRAGLPCIGSTVDAAGDLIVDDRTGFLVDPDDREALAMRIIALLTDHSMRRRFGAAARARYEERFTFTCFVSRLQDTLAEAFAV